ncbi:MAG: GC-type dockerin domain-anchored protein, partial [Planctomycetota bacterium]
GSFADIDIEPVGAIGPAHIVYRDGSVIVVICAADRDADGELTIFDFLAFQNLFDAGDLDADFDGDGVLTLFDFLAFQNAFDAGCP